MGLLLATESVPQDAQASYVQGLLQQLCGLIRSSLESDTSVIAVMGTSPPPRPSARSSAWPAPRAIPTEAMRINHALEAVSRLSKGFSLERMNRLRPKIGVCACVQTDIELVCIFVAVRCCCFCVGFSCTESRNYSLGVRRECVAASASAARFHESCKKQHFEYPSLCAVFNSHRVEG